MRRDEAAPPLPRPAEVRLVQAEGSEGPAKRRSVKPPFGLKAWSSGEETARVVRLVVPTAGTLGLGDIAQVAAQIPAARALPEGTLVVVLEHADRGGQGVTRLLRPSVSVPLAARCSGLLARGYVAIAAGVDDASREVLAWGFAPGADRPRRPSEGVPARSG